MLFGCHGRTGVGTMQGFYLLGLDFLQDGFVLDKAVANSPTTGIGSNLGSVVIRSQITGTDFDIHTLNVTLNINLLIFQHANANAGGAQHGGKTHKPDDKTQVHLVVGTAGMETVHFIIKLVNCFFHSAQFGAARTWVKG